MTERTRERTREPLPSPRQRACLSARLTDGEISGCLQRAYKSLSKEDQGNVMTVLSDILEIRNMGPKAALRLLFVVMFGDELDRLDTAIADTKIGGLS